MTSQISKEQMHDIIEWDIGNWSRAFVCIDNYFSEQDLSNKKILCVGERRGGMSLYFMLKGALNVSCTDIQYNFDDAMSLHRKYNCKAYEYKFLNVLEDIGNDEFDIICFKSVLGGVGGYGAGYGCVKIAVENMYRALKPGGSLVFMENLEASWIHNFARKKLSKKNSYRRGWLYLKYSDIKQLIECFKESNIETVGFFGAFGINEMIRQLFSKVDNVIDRLIKKDKRYIMSCIAIK